MASHTRFPTVPSSQYSSEQFQKLMAITASSFDEPFGKRLERCRDGNFLSSLKTERITCKIYRTHDAAKADVFDLHRTPLYACKSEERCMPRLLTADIRAQADVNRAGAGQLHLVETRIVKALEFDARLASAILNQHLCLECVQITPVCGQSLIGACDEGAATLP